MHSTNKIGFPCLLKQTISDLFFKLLILGFFAIIIYISFLIYTDGDLPGDSEELIIPMIDEAGKAINDLSNQLQEMSKDK